MRYMKITTDLTMVDEDHLGGFIIENVAVNISR